MMSTKGRVGGIMEKKGKSPSLPVGRRRSSPTPSILDRKKGSASIESRKVSSSNLNKHPSENIKPSRSLPPSKVTSTRSKPNEKNVSRSTTKITGSTKPKDVVKSRPPLRPKNVLNVKENTNASIKKQITKKGLENNVVFSNQNRIISDTPPPSKMDHNIITREDGNKTIPVFDDILMSDCGKQLLEDMEDDILNNNVMEIETPLRDPIDLSGNQGIPESEIRSRDNVTIDGSVDQEPTNGHDNEINVQDRVNETSEIASDRLLVPDHPKVVDQENGLEIEQVAQDSFIGSKDVESLESNDQDYEETTQKEPENQKTDPEEPKHEGTDLKEPEPEETEPKEPQDVETQVPKEPEHQETEFPEEPEHQETDLPEEPENKETELPEEPENKEIEVPEEPENKETEVPEELDQEETRVQEEPDHEEIEPKEPEHEETEPKELETEEPEELKHQETKEPEEPKHQESEQKEAENEPKEAEMKDGGEKEEDLRSKMVVKKQEVVAYGKKETGKAYNDVIEETVSKLRTQRKNRVKALVGAFETVISLESDE